MDSLRGQRLLAELVCYAAAVANLGGGSAFDQLSETFVEAAGTTDWSSAFPASNFPADGSYTLHARATDNNGEMQTRSSIINLLGGTFPDGTADMHSVVLEFKS